MPAGLTDEIEIQRRIELVADAKARCRASGRAELDLDELDRLLPPVDCARNRARRPLRNADVAMRKEP